MLLSAGYQLSDDEEFVIYVTADTANDHNDEYDENEGNNDTDAACTVRNTDSRASWECCDSVIEEEW